MTEHPLRLPEVPHRSIDCAYWPVNHLTPWQLRAFIHDALRRAILRGKTEVFIDYLPDVVLQVDGQPHLVGDLPIKRYKDSGFYATGFILIKDLQTWVKKEPRELPGLLRVEVWRRHKRERRPL